MRANRKEKKNFKWFILLTVIVGTFLGRLDQTIVNLALPKIIDDFSISINSAGWIITAYILANAIFVPIWGKLGDLKGQKKVYIIGFSLFIFGSALSGFAWNLGSMIVFRIIQAIASSADYPTAMAILALNFKAGRERAQALGIWSSSFAAASVIGPLLGGPLIDNFGWRSIFLVNIPVGIIGILMAMAFIKESDIQREKGAFDWWGAITLGISLSTLVLVLDKGMDWGWISISALFSYLTSIIFFYLFVKIENKHQNAIINLNFFKNKVFVTVLANSGVVFMGMMGAIFLVPIFAQMFLGYNATQAGYLFIPMAFLLVISASIGGRFNDKLPVRPVLIISTFVAGLGFYLFSFLDPRSGAWAIMIPMSILAIGIGFGMPLRTNIIASSVEPNEVGSASAVMALVRNIAGAFGVALFGTLLQNFQESNVLKIAQHSTIHIHSMQIFKQAIGLIILKADIRSYDQVFFWAAMLTMIGSFTAYWIKIKNKNQKKI